MAKIDKESLSDILSKISTLGTENRIENINLGESSVEIIYRRDGIDPNQKRVIESAILEKLAPYFSQAQIKVKTISNDGKDVYQTLKDSPPTSTKESAQLKVGHGAIGNKKPVAGAKKVIAVGSGKGGVGKSTFTVNLAYALKNEGLKIGVIDADIYGPSLPLLFGKRDAKPMANSEKKIIPIDVDGVKFISFGLFINEGDPVIWRGPMLGGVLNQFFFDVDWGELDCLIIDLPPGTGDVQLSMIQNTVVDEAIIISTPQDVALLDAVKGLEMFRKMNLPILGMVQNMSSFICDKCDEEHFIFGQAGVENAVKGLDVNFLGSIPLDKNLRLSSDQGLPYMNQSQFQGSKISQSYLDIAKKVKSKLFIQTEEKGFLGKIFSLGGKKENESRS